MKHTLYNFLILCLLACTTTQLQAQDLQCDRNFEIKAKVTASTCMANGVIEVALEGDLSGLDMTKAEYGLEPTSGTTGTTLLPCSDNILRGIAPGSYTLNVRTFCKVGDQYGRVKELLKVKVEGTYKPLMADFDQARSRKSYSKCTTGIIAFNITSNTGYGEFKFYITKAPAGVTLGEIFPVKGTQSGGYIPYTLPDLYPPGEYQIDIDDNCGKSTISFTLSEVVGMPASGSFGSTTYSLSRPYILGENCNVVRWNPSYYTPSSSTYPDYHRYYSDKMYEFALLPKGQTPTETDWKTWAYGSFDITLPGGYKDYHTSGSLSGHIRVKGCNEHTVFHPMYLPNPRMSITSSSGATRYCDYFTFSISNWTDYDNFWCYPVNITITNTSDNVVIYDETHPGLNTSAKDIKGKYRKDHTIKITGADGVSHNITGYNVGNPHISTSLNSYKCNGFTGSYYLYQRSYWNCSPVSVRVLKLKEGGNSNTPGDFNLFETYTFESSNNYIKTIEWEYGYYKIEATYPDYLLDDGTVYTSTTIWNVPPNRPTAYTLSTSSANMCIEDWCSLYVRSSSPSSGTFFPAGTVFTVIEAPVGYFALNKPVSSSSSNSYISFNQGHTPAGRYKIKVEDGCGSPVFVEANLNGAYSPRNTKLVVERNGCEGERLKLEGLVTGGGVNQPSYTYFQIISGPKGFDNISRPYNGSILLTADGDYTVVVKTSLSTTCYLKTETIKFVKSKPTLKPAITSSYICTDKNVGYIIVSGQDGTEPYTYDLLNEDKTPTGAVATDAGSGRSSFNYGTAGKTYFVRITDACGNYNEQEIKIIDLETQRVVYNTPPSGEYCFGGTIELHCVTLGETTYLWKGPNNFESTEQSPKIHNATEAMTGYYTVSVMPEFCGESVTDQLFIKVFPELMAGTVTPDQEVCVATRATTMGSVATGGKGLHNYQWQSSTDGNTWINILGADRATYDPPIFTKSGRYYFRLQTTDDCKIVLSQVITLDVKPCYIMVNPNMRHKVKK